MKLKKHILVSICQQPFAKNPRFQSSNKVKRTKVIVPCQIAEMYDVHCRVCMGWR